MSQPTIFQVGQFLLDLSFENFAVSAPVTAAPAIQVNVNVEARRMTGQDNGETVSGDFDSILSLQVTARPAKDGQADGAAKPLFIVELHYGARYRVADIPSADLEQFLLIEAPRFLFPFARQIAADAAQHGGLPPLMLTPIDFAQIYQQRKAAA